MGFIPIFKKKILKYLCSCCSWFKRNQLSSHLTWKKFRCLTSLFNWKLPRSCSPTLQVHRTTLMWGIKIQPHWSLTAVQQSVRGMAISPQEPDPSGTLQSCLGCTARVGFTEQTCSPISLTLEEGRQVPEPAVCIVAAFWRKWDTEVVRQVHASKDCTLTGNVYFIPLLFPLCYTP